MWCYRTGTAHDKSWRRAPRCRRPALVGRSPALGAGGPAWYGNRHRLPRVRIEGRIMTRAPRPGGRATQPSFRAVHSGLGDHALGGHTRMSVRLRPQEAPQEGAVSRGGAGPVTHELGERVGEGEGACHFFCVCGLEVGGDPVGVGGGELGEGLFPVGGELALDETGWGGAFAGGFALVLVAFAGAFVAVAGLLATVVQLRPRRRRVVAAVLGRPCAVGRSRTLWRWWRGPLPRQWGRHDAAPRGREALGTA